MQVTHPLSVQCCCYQCNRAVYKIIYTTLSSCGAGRNSLAAADRCWVVLTERALTARSTFIQLWITQQLHMAAWAGFAVCHPAPPGTASECVQNCFCQLSSCSPTHWSNTTCSPQDTLASGAEAAHAATCSTACATCMHQTATSISQHCGCTMATLQCLISQTRCISAYGCTGMHCVCATAGEITPAEALTARLLLQLCICL